MTANTSRSLSQVALASALATRGQIPLSEVANIPTVKAAAKLYQLPLTCQYTGINCGLLTLPTTAGYLPLLSQWKQQQVLHPVFSLEPLPLLAFAKNTWIRFCGFTAEEAEDTDLTAKQEQMLRITALALLHHLSDIRQDIPWLPEFLEIQNNWQSLIGLSYWKAYLDSKRFRFPALRISKQEPSINIQGYLQACWDKKKEYETAVNERADEERAVIAERALLSIRDELAGKRPVSTKLLWRWFLQNLSKKYAPDTEGWMHTLFFSKDILSSGMVMADIDLFEEIFLSECPTGTSVSFAFLEVLRSKRKLLEQHFDAFEIIIPEALQAAADSGEIAADEPKAADFASKGKFMIAHAKWKLTHGATGGNTSKHRDAAAAKQQQTTVTASHVPVLNTGRARDFAELLEQQFAEVEEVADKDAIDYVAPDSVAAMLADDVQAESGNYED